MLEKQEQEQVLPASSDVNVPPKRRLLAASGWWVVLVALGLAALYGRVALLNLGTGVVGGDLDGYENLWNDYWVRHALLDLHRNPFFTDYIYYPTGISLRYHTLNPLNGLFALPLWPLIGSVASTNLKFLVAMALTNLCAYLLLKDLTGATWPAFLGAAVFTYANNQLIGFFSLGQAEKLSQWWLPLYLWLILRSLNRPRWLLYGLAAVLTLVAMALTDWQYVLYAVLFTVAYALFDLLWRRQWQRFARLAGIGFVWLGLVAVPLLLPILKDAADNPWLVSSEQADNRARALSDFYESGVGNPGYLVLIVTIVGLGLLVRRGLSGSEGQTLAFWGLVIGLSSLLSLGGHLRLTPTEDVTKVGLPYDWLGNLPVLNIGRDPGRYWLLAMLGLGVMLAFALRELGPVVKSWLARWLKPRATRLVSGLLAGTLLAVTLGGFVSQAGLAQVNPPDWPPFYYTLAQDKEQYALMELPLFTEKGRGEDTYEAYQSIHGKPRLGGRLARDHKLSNPNNFTKQATLFRDFFWLNRPDEIERYRPNSQPDFLPTPDYTQLALPLLNFYNVRYIILYLDALNQTGPNALANAEKLVRQTLGADARPVYEDTKMKAYRVPTEPANGQFFLDTGSTGWYNVEKNPTRSYRWADSRDGQSADLSVFNLSQQTRPAQVRFTVLNYKAARRVDISFDGYPAASFPLDPDATHPVVLDLNVPPGLHKISLTSPDPARRDPASNDNRPLTFCVYDISWSTSNSAIAADK